MTRRRIEEIKGKLAIAALGAGLMIGTFTVGASGAVRSSTIPGNLSAVAPQLAARHVNSNADRPIRIADADDYPYYRTYHRPYYRHPYYRRPYYGRN
jgi:hypothetical protein